MTLNNIKFRFLKFIKHSQKINLLDFNKFIFREIIVNLIKTEHLLPIVIAVCIAGFSVIVELSNYIFLPQTSIGAYASFFLFTLVVSLVSLVIYPTLIIILVNFISSHIRGNSRFKMIIKLLALLAGFIAGTASLASHANIYQKIQIVFIWIGLYLILINLYLAHHLHNNLFKLTRTKIILILLVSSIMVKPLVLIYIHISEAINYTTINPQVYLPPTNCQLLRNFNENKLDLDNQQNTIFNDRRYYQELPNNQGCYLYGNTIRYGFAYDYVLLIKQNIKPIQGRNGTLLNEYVRLNCYAGNCYSENHIYFKTENDIYSSLMEKTRTDTEGLM